MLISQPATLKSIEISFFIDCSKLFAKLINVNSRTLFLDNNRAKLTLLSTCHSLQDPNADTQWNDVLRAKGIIPPKETEISEDQIVSMVEQTIEDKTKGENELHQD